MEEENTHVDSNDKQACEMHRGGETHRGETHRGETQMKKKVFYIVQEVPYADFYNFDYEPIDSFRKSGETQCIDGDTSTSSSSCGEVGEVGEVGSGRTGKRTHASCCCAGHQQGNNAHEEGEKRECAEYYYQGGENPSGGCPSGGRPSGGRPNGGHPNGEHPNGVHPNGEHPNGEHPNGEHPNGGHPNGGHPNGGHPNGGHPSGGPPSGAPRRKSELREGYPLANKPASRRTPAKKRQKIKRKNEFLKQCEFNSDGSCYYTISNSNYLRLFATDLLLLNALSKGSGVGSGGGGGMGSDGSNGIRNGISNGGSGEGHAQLRALHEEYERMDAEEKEKRNQSWICMQLGEHIYDCKFYPFFDWNNSNTCFFAVSSKGSPVCLYSAYDGSSIMSFKTFNHCQELCNSYSLCFHPDRNWLLCGTNDKSIKVFDFAKPNEVYENRILSTRRGRGQKGIISTMTYKKKGYGKNTMYAVGDYNDCIYLYADNCDHKNDFILKFQVDRMKSNGITCIKWIDEFSLLSGSRNGSFIYRYDMRKNTEYVQKWERFALTNQKYLFDVYRDFLLISGSGTRRFYENNSNKVDIMASVFSGGMNTSYHNAVDGASDRNAVDGVSPASSSIPFPSVSRYINSACTVWCDFAMSSDGYG
ncbi:hypothetical protein PCYB_124780 [Plasmodium cynomolgi strain B]|uniref:Uncharacterized protein n=1 Tax=Plasmodium cynomolgi (strain B) TaxID=1120755 RepID=K6VF49_PLACD|nr:hypothetical protein PCYB_124780 [Plasmodium cynomolgi strain B]GAB67912.1 hypothetical protein PCYB_124780 [Plasmodium cynomolgi strain B]